MLKNTSLVSVISLYDLLGAAEAIGSPTFRTLELLTVACIWYLLMTTVWTIIQSWLERRFNASTRDPGSGKSIWDLLLSPNTYAWPILRRSGVGGMASR
jgi:polar amino acid transport system permease protein